MVQFKCGTLNVVIGMAVAASLLVAEDKASLTTLITARAHHGTDVPDLKPVDVTITTHGDRPQITSLTPLTGSDARLELFLLIDDSIDSSLGSQFEELRHFIQTQPATTAIGVAYMARGSASIVQNPTSDHAVSAAALRLPNWRGGPSPYESVKDLIKHWPQSPANTRREIVMVSTGADETENPYDPYLAAAANEAQLSGVVVYTIYAPTRRSLSASDSQLGFWQGRLARLAAETGGESYLPPSGAAVTFQPYLASVAELLQHQYRVTFLVKPGKGAELRDVKFSTALPKAEIAGQRKVWIPLQP